MKIVWKLLALIAAAGAGAGAMFFFYKKQEAERPAGLRIISVNRQKKTNSSAERRYCRCRRAYLRSKSRKAAKRT